ncbi:MAG: S1C family serine protease [Lachnospiraceae bacterium]
MQDKEENTNKKPYIRERIVKTPKSRLQLGLEWTGKTVGVLAGVAIVGCVFGGTFTWGSYMVSSYYARETSAVEESSLTEGISQGATSDLPSKDETTSDMADTAATENTAETSLENLSETTIETDSTGETQAQEMGVEAYEQLNQSLFEVYENVSQSFVTVNLITQDMDWLNEPIENRSETFGVILSVQDTKVTIVTSYHQVKEAKSLTVNLQGQVLDAVILAKDDLTDICTLQVDLEGIVLKEELQPIVLAYNYVPKAGEAVILAGNPMGFSGSVVFTNLTYINKDVSVTDGVCRILYTDQFCVDGGSGVILNIQGEVIGWITENYKSSNLQDIVAGIGIRYLKDILNHLTENSPMTLFGVTAVNMNKVETSDKDLQELKGIYVSQVLQNSPAYQAGIQYGDILMQIDGKNVYYQSVLQSTLEEYEPGDKVSVLVSRKGRDGYKTLTFEVELGAR